MTKYLWSLIGLLVFVHVNVTTFAQEDYEIQLIKSQFKAKQVIAPSPDAAALGKYGNVPVSLFTGTPTINIPLTELKGNVLQLPVSMSYNSTGFKPDEIASWVGLGWTLNAGGVITRAVAGAPDASTNYFKSPSPILDPASIPKEFDRQVYYRDLSLGTDETQPDMYFYNFNGRSGKFYVAPTGLIFKKEKDMLEITPNPSVDGFNIKDEMGNLYVFTKTEISNTLPTDAYGASPIAYQYTSSWYLTSITSADGVESIVFDYWAPTAQQDLYQGALLQQSSTWSYMTTSCVSTPSSVERSDVFSAVTPTKVTRKFLKTAKLVRSGTDVAYIDFGSLVDQRTDLWNADFAGERRLDTVKLYVYLNGTAVLSKYVKLFYSYFPTTQQANGGLKLRLDKIQEMAIKVGTPDNSPYLFEYNTGNLPKKHPFGIDHWGYYNGASNSSLLPDVQSTIEGTAKNYGDGANRSPSFANTSLAMISKITYPTGGSSVFEFELNGAVGGLRIKKITDYSFTGTVASAKLYTYASQYASPTPKYDTRSNYSSFSIGCVGTLCDCPNTGKKSVTISSTSVYGLGFSRGTHVGYAKVTESQTNAANDPVGQTVYHYATGAPFEADDDIRTGQLIKQETFDNGNKLLREVTNSYIYSEPSGFDYFRIVPEINQDNKKKMCEKADFSVSYYHNSESPTCNRTPTQIETRFTYFDVTIRQQKNLLGEQIVKHFDQLSNTYITTRKKYTYGTNHNSPTLIEEQSSNNGELLMTSVKYTGDYNYTSVTSDPVASALQTANTNNMKALEVEKVQYRTTSSGTNPRYLKGILTTYLSNGLPNKVYGLELSAPLTSFTASTISSGLLTFNSNFKLQGTMTYSGHNLVEQAKTNDMPTNYIWDFINSRPVASVVNASVSSIAYTSFETSATGGWTIPSTSYNVLFLTGKRSFNIAGITISKTFTVTTQKQVVSYWKNGSGSLTVTANSAPVAASAQAMSSLGWYYYEHIAPVGTTSIQVSGSGTIDDLRTFPINSQMTTFGFAHETGLTAQIDPYNKPTYFDYDGLNRLVNVKDDQGNIVKNYRYNYGLGSAIVAPKKIFYNTTIQGDYTKQCTATGAFGTVETYVVPGGKHAALTQVAAQNLASADLAGNGQAYANANGECYYKSAAYSKAFYKSDCEYYQGPGSTYNFFAPSGMFTSILDQATADNLAIAYVNNNGQEQADLYGHCMCDAEGKRYFGGIQCEAGTRIEYSYTYLPATDNYQCKYYYEFSDGSVSQFYYRISPTPCIPL